MILSWTDKGISSRTVCKDTQIKGDMRVTLEDTGQETRINSAYLRMHRRSTDVSNPFHLMYLIPLDERNTN